MCGKEDLQDLVKSRQRTISVCKSLKNRFNLNGEAGNIGQKGHLIPAKGRGKDY